MKLMKTMAMAAVLVAATLQTQADNTWDGSAADGLWTNDANWSLNVAPAPGQGNFFFSDQTYTNKITIGSGDSVTLDGDMYGPEWGMDLVIDGGSLIQNPPGFVWAPVADSGDHCVIDVKNDAYFEVSELLLGDNWWFSGHPYVDLNISGTGTVVKARGWMWLGGRINLESGTLEVGGNINFDASAAGYAQIDIAEGTILCTAVDVNPDLTNRFETAISNNQVVAYGGLGDVIMTYDSGNFDLYVTAVAPPFIVDGSPTDSSTNTTRTLEAKIVDLSSEFVEAVLSLDGTPVETNSTPAGTTNTISYVASGLSAGMHTGTVAITGTPDSFTNSWTFEVLPFVSVTVSPEEWAATDSPTLQAVVIEAGSIVDTNATAMYLDGALVTPVFDRSAAPTTTISYAASGLSQGAHTGKVVVAGSPGGTATAEWTFNVVLEGAIATSLAHHWNFEEGTNATVYDVVGGADGTIINTNFTWVDGGLDLAGGGTSGAYDGGLGTNTAAVGSYVDLPNGLLTGLSTNAVTFEVAYVADDAEAWWQRVWDMGESVGGENLSNGGGKYSFLTIHSFGGGPRVALSTNNPGSEAFALDTTYIVAGEISHVVWVYDPAGQMTKLYHNGVLVNADVVPDWPLSSFANMDVNNWLGRAQFNDGMFDGKLYDFRIYTGIMTASEAADRYDEVINSGGPTVDPDIQSIAVSGGSATLTWTSESGVTYSILSKSALTDATWSTNKAGIASAGDGTTSDSVTAGADAEFYQIKGE